MSPVVTTRMADRFETTGNSLSQHSSLVFKLESLLDPNDSSGLGSPSSRLSASVVGSGSLLTLFIAFSGPTNFEDDAYCSSFHAVRTVLE
ncbi:hypothetical protein ECG_07338 [Echinococcus granulosus]|uniref:Uncharacterized protein n=1 Tax=Echinococcus granulosus TaxID=6210 RepID=A0A068WU54_ECHGR|nr:hypothetical protein ECG_07338 [Echinococcus granulosus]CDS22023.1 hypothetical protein EgrG_002024700 [Echinococcus granulosus]